MIFAQARFDHPGMSFDILGPNFHGGVFWKPIPRIPVIIDVVGSRDIIFRWELDFLLLIGVIHNLRPVAADYFFGLIVKVCRHSNLKTCVSALEDLLVLLEDSEGDVHRSELPANGDALALIFACPHFPSAGVWNHRSWLGKLIYQVDIAVCAPGETIAIFAFAFRTEHNRQSLLHREDNA